MRCDWTSDQVKALQKRLGVWPSGNLEHETWGALQKELRMVIELPIERPVEKDSNPYSVKNHLLYKDEEQVSYKLSPNHGGIITPEIIVIHYTGDNNTGGLRWLTEKGSGVSAHLWIAKTGVVWQLLPFNFRGWHAGVSSWNGRYGCNDFSIGIENQGLGDEWPEAQIKANIDVINSLRKAYDIVDLVGHSDVAPDRKVDPGPKYPWVRIREATGF